MTIIREYREEDRQRLHSLAMQNYTAMISGDASGESSVDGAEAYFEHILQMQNGGKGFVFVAEDKDSLIGFVCLMAPVGPVEGRTNEAPYGFISDLFIVPERRRQGVATSLNAKIEQQMRALGVTRLALRVVADNSAARNFYSREGYAEQFVVMSKQVKQ